MSRSYKKNPIVRDGNHSKKFAKKCANKKVQTYINENGEELMPQNKSYVKLFCQYDIADYRSRWTEEDAIKQYYAYKNSPDEWKRKMVNEQTLEEWLIDWFKWYKRK